MFKQTSYFCYIAGKLLCLLLCFPPTLQIEQLNSDLLVAHAERNALLELVRRATQVLFQMSSSAACGPDTSGAVNPEVYRFILQ